MNLLLESVCSALAKHRDVEVHGLAITEVARSGLPEELIEKYGISCKKIIEKVKEIVSAH